MGKSSCSSPASRAANRSNTSFTTALGRASDRSTLLMTTIGRRPTLSAFDTTNLVCGSGPSAASTSTSAPSTILRMRSTSPPKSAWPGVSTMLMRMSRQGSEVTLARMVMPRSRSRSLESMARSATRWFSRKAPDCCSSRSSRVVLPWSTWAMIATLRNDIWEIRWGPAQPGYVAAQYMNGGPNCNGKISARPECKDDRSRCIPNSRPSSTSPGAGGRKRTGRRQSRSGPRSVRLPSVLRGSSSRSCSNGRSQSGTDAWID